MHSRQAAAGWHIPGARERASIIKTHRTTRSTPSLYAKWHLCCVCVCVYSHYLHVHQHSRRSARTHAPAATRARARLNQLLRSHARRQAGTRHATTHTHRSLPYLAADSPLAGVPRHHRSTHTHSPRVRREFSRAPTQQRHVCRARWAPWRSATSAPFTSRKCITMR